MNIELKDLMEDLKDYQRDLAQDWDELEIARGYVKSDVKKISKQLELIINHINQNQ